MISGTGIVNDSPNGQDLVLDNTNSLDFYNSATITGDVGISIPDADFDANYSTFVAFSDNSSAGTANFIITSYKANVFFQDFSTAGTSTITINGLDSKPVFWEYSVYCSADFTGSSSADHATINVSGGGTTTPSFVEFSGTSSAGNATITTLPGGVDADRANYVQFNDSATAGSATITLSGNNGQHVQFGDTSTAGNATITANGDSSSVVIKGSATGALASIDLAHSTTFLDISKLDVDSTHIGSLEGWGQVRLGLKNLIVGDNNRSTTFGGEVSGGSGANGLEKSGTGTLTLIGNNSYVGHTTLDAGTLCLGSSGALGTTGLVDFQGGTLQYTANNTTDYSSRFVGSTTQKYRVDTNGQNVTWAADLNTNYGLTKSGLGTLTLAGHNTISDLVAINAGVLNLGSNEALDGVGGIRFGGGTLQYSTLNNNDYSSRFSLDANQPYRVDTNNQDVTWAARLTSPGGSLVKNGNGTLTLTRSNQFSGGVTVNQGTLAAGAAGAISMTGTLSVAPTASLQFAGTSTAADTTIHNDGVTRFLDSATSGASSIDGSGIVWFLSTSTAGTTTFNSMGGASLGFTDSASGGHATLTVGNSSGVLVFGGSSTAGNATIHVIDTLSDYPEFDANSTAGHAIINLSGADTAVMFNGDSQAESATFNLTGTNSAVGFTASSSAGNATFNLTEAHSGVGFRDSSSAGNATITASGNNSLVAFSSLSDGGQASVNLANPTSKLDVSGMTSLAVGSVEGSGTVDLGSTHLTIGGNGRNTVLSGAITGAGGGSLTKTGNGTLTLTGANSYTGATSVTAGTLALVGGSQTSAITVSDGASLGFTLGSPTTSTQTLTFSGATAKVRFTGTPSVASYTLMTASAITGTPVLDPAIPGCTLAVEGGGTILKLYATLSGYAAWAATNAPTGTAGDDYDGDGVSNGVEYLLGGTRFSNDRGKLPQLTTTGGNMVFSFIRDQQSIDGVTTVNIEVGTDLATWPTRYAVPAVAAANDPGVTVVKDSPVAGQDTVTLTIPQTSNTKQFARLQVTPP